MIFGKNVYFFGDSITKGIGANPILQKRWTKILCDLKKWKEHNYGADGATLEYSDPVNPWNVQSGYERRKDIPLKNINDRYLFIAYGINDCGFNIDGYNTTLFKQQFREILQEAINKKWIPSRIIILTGYFVKEPECWEIYLNVVKNKIPSNHFRYLKFIEATLDIAKEFSCKTIVPYNYLSNIEDEKILAKDKLHLNNTGNELLAKYIASILS